MVYGFQFPLSVLAATLVKLVTDLLHKRNISRREHHSGFLMVRASNFFLAIMVAVLSLHSTTPCKCRHCVV